ncbi:MAG: hypothetical protein NVSMB51_21530 [Solirubrobacteraceae bacterium]
MAARKLILTVIDGAKPSILERAVADGKAPSLGLLIERGSYVRDAVAVFPSVTPVCAASIATGLGQDRHLIPSMNWYSRAEGRYVEYGSSFRAARRFGFAQQLTDTVYNMNGAHLAADALTVFERLDDEELRTVGTTYLMYRGRHRHEASQDTALARFASRALIRHPVMGPRDLFYADVFSSRDTGCRSQLGMPGVRDRHAGCVGSYMVEHDLFDFMLLSLPDNDNHSHKYGPHAQVDSIGEADRQIGRLIESGGGAEAFLERYAMIVIADHSHASVEASISLNDEFTDFVIAQPGGAHGEGVELAVCPAQRSAMLYLLAPGLLERVLARARAIPGVDLVMWLEQDGRAVIAGEQGELRFAPGDQLRDPRGRNWRLDGELAVLGARIEEGVLHSERYPDALGRAWDALACATSGEILISAAPAYEFRDWGGADHVGGGSHGSLHASDSLAPLICCGLAGDLVREQWSIRDASALVLAHFGLA